MKRLTAALILLVTAGSARATGLRTPFGEVVIRNLKIGQTYSMYKLVNLPLRVVNTGDQEVDLRIETVAAKDDELRKGYERIPSLDWLRVEKGTFTVAPNREVATDLIISVPNDPALLGRRFEADIWSHTSSARGVIAVGLQSKLLLQIDSTPPTEEELKKRFVDEKLANLDFTVTPSNGLASGVAVGREVDLRKEHKIVVKVVNPNEEPLNFRVRSIPVWESLISVPDGYEAAADPKWLTPESGVLKVDADSIASMDLRLRLPDEERVRGRNLFFIVSFEILEQKIPTKVYYRLMVNTADDGKRSARER